jgi:hypothetical protein
MLHPDSINSSICSSVTFSGNSQFGICDLGEVSDITIGIEIAVIAKIVPISIVF